MKTIPQDKNENPVHLQELHDKLLEVCDKFDTTDDAVFVMGTHWIDDEDEENSGVQTFIGFMGNTGVLVEGLIAEMTDQMERGESALFIALREAVRATEEILGIEPNEEVEEEDERQFIH